MCLSLVSLVYNKRLTMTQAQQIKKSLRQQLNVVVTKMEAIRFEAGVKARIQYNRLQKDKDSLIFQINHTR